jgi:hypothetical protein
MGHVKDLEKTSCKYPIRRIEVKVDTVPSGNMNYIQDNMFLGQLNPSVLCPSSVQTCLGPSMLSGT